MDIRPGRAQPATPTPGRTRPAGVNALLTLDARTSRLLDLSSYGALAVMGTLGVIGLPDAGRRVIAILLCLAFGATIAIGPRLARTTVHQAVLFGGQTVLVTALVLLRSEDYASFAFLFYVLSLRVPLAFSDRVTIAWIAALWLISSAGSILTQSDNAWFIAVFNLGVFPLCGLFGYALRGMTEARAEGERALIRLREAQHQVQQLAIAEERHRLSRDLHDSVKQRVFAMIMQLGTARVLIDQRPEAARESIEHAERLARQAGSELNLVIRELRPVELDGLELPDALRRYARDWSRETGIEALVEIDGDPADDDPVPDHVLLRITQEALSNVARHSKAGRCLITLRFTPEIIMLTITDDGCGFASSEATGVGLASMRERTEALGGSLYLQTRPGAGTSITAQWERHD